MSIAQKLPKVRYWSKQACPLCGDDKILITNGVISPAGDNKVEKSPDRGYSFCNCKNIWFTDWSNMDREVFKDINEDEHSLEEVVFKEYFASLTLRNAGYKRNKFLTVGVTDHLLIDTADRLGFQVTGVEMFERKGVTHPMILGDFEEVVIDKKFDLIWAYHIFEHFHYPIKALEKCHELLEPKGVIFIAMPDPFFIDFDNIYSFDHFLLRQHHIMWDMESFIEEAVKVGFKVALSKRNTEMNSIQDMHIILVKS